MDEHDEQGGQDAPNDGSKVAIGAGLGGAVGGGLGLAFGEFGMMASLGIICGVAIGAAL